MNLIERIIVTGIIAILFAFMLTYYWETLDYARGEVRDTVSFADGRIRQALSWTMHP